MENKQEILQELQDISPLIAGIQAVNPFRVPEEYFAAFPGIVLEKVRIESLLVGGTAGTYAVPAGYFEGLSTSILGKIKTAVFINNEVSAELEEVAALLNTISRQNVYTVPADYFTSVDFATAAKNVKKEAKVVTLRIARKWMQYAAAAVMAGILVTGAFLYTDNNEDLGKITELPDVSSGLNKVSESDLVTYLDNPEHFVAAPAATSLASEEELVDVKNNIRRVSDEELNQYLKENAESFDGVAAEKEK
ncbi:MAG: hypothetical protein ABIS69_09150 [Sediminibacterium sp.]